MRVWVLLAVASVACGQPAPQQADLFRAGEGGYHTYRIPSLIVTKKGTLLAFCEGRRNSRSDSGDIDLLLRRSLDNGATWGPVQLVADHGEDTIGNPTPVVDRKTGVIWLLLTMNPGRINQKQILAGEGTRTVWISRSGDDGATWAKPVEITASVKRPNWTWYATGPGIGIQLKSGRLIVPCDHSLTAAGGTIERRSHVIYSDDHGRTWKIGGVLGKETNECQIAERTDGSLLLNMRSLAGKNRRAVATSRDGGITWSDVTLDEALIEPGCQASLLRYSRKPPRLLFSNPADTRRDRLTVRLSSDEGRTWSGGKLLWEGPSGYSPLAVLRDSSIACLYERGEASAYETITFARFRKEWLAGGAQGRR